MVGRRKFIRTVSFFAALCVAIGVASVFSSRAKASYEEKLEKMRFQALNSLCEYAREISSGLSLLAVSAGDAVADSSAYVNSRAAAAIGNAACFDKEKTANINKFLQAVYDLTQDFEDNEESRKNAEEFSDYAEELYYHLSDISLAVSGGKYSLSEYGSVYSSDSKPYFEHFLDFKAEIAEKMQNVRADVQNSEFIGSKETVSVEDAKEKASRVVDIPELLWRTEEKTANGTEFYAFTHDDTEIRVCRSGGNICYIVNPKPCSKAVYSVAEVSEKGKDFVENCGYDADVLLGVKVNEFTADFCFVPEVNGVLLADASVFVSVCLASGGITFFDSFEYIKNYRTDISAETEISDLSGVLPDNLTAEKIYLSFADIKGKDRLCFLAVCPFEGEKLFAFIDYNEMKVLEMKKYAFTDLY